MSSLPARFCAALLVAVVSMTALANPMSPVGTWNTMDDETKKPKSLVRIIEKDGVFSGTVEKIVDPKKQDSKCDECAARSCSSGGPRPGSG